MGKWPAPWRHVSWENCLIDPRRDRALEAYARRKTGIPYPLVRYSPCIPSHATTRASLFPDGNMQCDYVASGSSFMRESSETIAGGKVFGGGNRSRSARPMAVSMDFCAASSHICGRPFGDARRFLISAKQKSRALVP